MLENKRTNIQDSNIVSFIPNGDYYFQKALQALDKEQMDKAYKYIKRAAELSPDDAQILMQYGIIQMDFGRYEHAYELIHTAYSIEPSNPDIVFMLAEVSGYIGFIGDAKKYAEKYLTIEPNGMYQFEAEDILQFAEEEKELMIELDGDDKTKIIALEKSRRLMEQGDFPQAIEVLEQIVEAYPTEWPAYNNLALAYFYLGELEQAISLLNEVMRETKGTNLHALCNLAVIAYSQEQHEELASFIEVLNKIQPYNFENRHKLGVTLALIGQHEVAFKWLQSLNKRGYDGDAGFYFWLANSAYFSGHEQIAHTAWDKLIELDPSKVGLEPWLQHTLNPDYMPANDRDYIINKLNGTTLAETLVGCVVLNYSPHKQEILAHPKWINVDNFHEIEKYALAYILDHPLNDKDPIQKQVKVAMEAAELIINQYNALNMFSKGCIEQVFSMFELAYLQQQPVKNPKALAATADFIFRAITGETVTKKEIATTYDISVSTLTKYCNLYFSLLPQIPDELLD